VNIGLYHLDLPETGRKPGGVAVAVHRLGNALALRGHAVTVSTYSPAPSDAQYRVRRLRPHWAPRSTVLRQYVFPIARNIEPHANEDVLHLHGDDWFYLRRRLPTVRTFHGTSRREAASATSLARRLDKSLVALLERQAGRLADVTVAVGPEARDALATDLLIPPGIDDRPAPAIARSAAPSILFVGTWEGRKRGAWLASQFRSSVIPQVPGAELWMVSDRCEETAGIRWFAAPTDDELQRLYAQAWTFCLPSTYEGFGIPYVEALAAGTPVVATPNPGAAYILRDGRDGFLAADGELAAALVALLGDPEKRGRIGSSGLARARDFMWSALVGQYEGAYDLAVERHLARRSRHRPGGIHH
jgi:phosphatidyl-myo-inositol alpha-mannosyltransferase